MSRIAPYHHETLAQFFVRARAGKSVNALARELAASDGKEEKTWLRTLRRLGGRHPQESISAENAEAIGAALNADFASFVRRQDPTRALLEDLRDELVGLRRRVGRLERRLGAQ